jgi:Sigma-54, DNA binding domain
LSNFFEEVIKSLTNEKKRDLLGLIIYGNTRRVKEKSKRRKISIINLSYHWARTMNKGTKNTLNLELKNSLDLKVNLRLFNVLSSGENDILEMVRKIESDKLFIRLSGKTGDFPRVITYNHRNNTGYAWLSNLENDGFVQALDTSISGAEIISGRGQVIEIIRTIGSDNFEKYFLGYEKFSTEEICKICAINEKVYNRIMSFVAVYTHAYENVPMAALPVDYFSMIASIIKEKGGFRIEYTSMHYGQGEYSIDNEKLKALKNEGLLTKKETGNLSGLLDLINTVNCRKRCACKIVEGILKYQMPFFTGEGGQLLPMSQRTLASQIGISYSSVSRIINRKTLKMPWGSEIALKDFFVSRRKFLIDKVRDILLKYSKGKKLTDKEIGDILNKKHGLKVSRRSVNLYRKAI